MKKPFAEVTHNGHHIIVSNKAAETALIIDGEKMDTYTGRIVSSSFSLNGAVNGDSVRADFKLRFFWLVMFLYYNDTLLTKKWHI